MKATFAKLAFLALIGWSHCVSHGQEAKRELETDRDSFTQALTVVGEHRLMLESAWSYIDNRHSKDTHSFPELLLRYGVTEEIEIRFGTNYEVGGEPSSVSGNSGTLFERSEGHDASELVEESLVRYGVKTQLSTQRGWVPLSAVTLTGTTPTSGPATTSNLLVGSVFGWELPNRWVYANELRYGLQSIDGDGFNSWAPSSVLQVPLSEATKIHVEYFGIFSDGAEVESVKHFFSSGAHHLLRENLEIGLRVGWGLNDQSPNFFTNFGFGWFY